MEATKKYELISTTNDIKKSFEDYEVGDGQEGFTVQEVIKTFTSKEEALKELKKYRCSVDHETVSPEGTFISVTEYLVCETEYDADGKLCRDCGIVGFAPLSDEGTVVFVE